MGARSRPALTEILKLKKKPAVTQAAGFCISCSLAVNSRRSLRRAQYPGREVEDDHFLTVCRYVERNALRAGLVSRA
jgi:hypothetical protein